MWLRNTTYADLQAVTDPAHYTELTTVSHYRKTISENSEALTEQMPFYTIRMAYLWTMRLTSKIFSMPIAKTTYMLSSFFAGLCVFFLFFFLKPKNIWLVLAFPIVIIFSGFPELSVLSTTRRHGLFRCFIESFLLSQK